MRYPVFLGFDIVGGMAWGGGATLAGYFLGTVPFVHQNLEKIILAILFVSLIPAMLAAWRGYRGRSRAAKQPKEEASGHPTSAVRNESV
jgi:membrane-associated protein